MVQEVTTQSWFSRLGNAFVGIIIGILLIIGSFILIFWNEGHSQHVSKSLEQTAKVVIDVPAAPIDPKNNLKVVHLTGTATTAEQLQDPLFQVSAQAIRLIRNVEMYQWQQKETTETEKQYGGSVKVIRTYTYDQVWSSNLIDSANFKEVSGHENPTSMPFTSETWQAKEVKLGDFILPVELVNQITNRVPINFSDTIKTELSNKTKLTVINNANVLYLGDNVNNPKVGDIRITETQVLPQPVSIVAQQINNTLQPYIPKAGQPVLLLQAGTFTAEDMLHTAKSNNEMLAWIWRILSLAMLIFGLSLILRPISVITDVIPFLGTLFDYGIGFVSICLGIAIWGVATAIAWFMFRPLLAILILIVVIAIVFGLIKLRQRKVHRPA